MTAPLPSPLQAIIASREPHCRCGHPLSDHDIDNDARCYEPTGRCECTDYQELCLVCAHPKSEHTGYPFEGKCTRTLRKNNHPCGCQNYPAETEASA